MVSIDTAIVARDTNYSPPGEYLQLRLPLLRMQNGTKLHRWLLLPLLRCCRCAAREQKMRRRRTKAAQERAQGRQTNRKRAARPHPKRTTEYSSMSVHGWGRGVGR